MDAAADAETEHQFRVLVVDDDPAIRRTYLDVLRDQGFPTAAAESGRRALQILMQQSFDVLVVDLRMEEMDGILFLQEALKIWPWLGVVIVSAYISRDVPERAAKLGVTSILEKPVAIGTLVDNIEAEGREKRKIKADIPQDNALELLRDHLKLLAGVNHRSLGGNVLAGALREFGGSLANVVPSDLVGILVIEENSEPTLILSPQRPVSPDFIGSVKAEVMDRFKALSGKTLDEATLVVQAPDANQHEDAPSEVGNTVSVPLLIDNNVCGLLTLATVSDEGYTAADVSLLYHTANHISAVFTALRRMHALATRDPLTGIFNRVRLEEELERAWLTSRRYNSSMGVVVVDIDNFKTINDAYGHAIGDEVIRDFARVMLSAARSTDMIARYGGDEFVAILPRASEVDARRFAERLLKSTREHMFCRTNHRLSLTASVGVATSDNATAPSTSAALLGQADRALYTAKRSGHNRICVWPGKAFKPDPRSLTPSDDTADDSAMPEQAPRAGARIIVVEDEEPIRRLVSLMLEKSEHTVAAFNTAGEAMDEIRHNADHFDILVTDIGLPDRSGIDLMHEIGAIDDSIVKVVMTGQATLDNAILCMREGAYDFIQKPIDQDQLLALIDRALEYRELKLENDRYQAHLEAMVRERSAKLAASLQDIQAAYEFTLDAMVRMLDARERQTARHSKRVRELAVRLAQEVGLSIEDQETIAQGAFLHDIGKIAIPDNILLKPGPLDANEWRVMKTHSQTGYDILRSSPHLQGVAQIVLEHHEHWDGSGYPQELKAGEICLGARVFGVIDAFDAMRGERVYSDSLSAEETAAEIVRNSGTQFDPEVVKAFVRCQADLEMIIGASGE